jgi:cysteine desulfuration protein SufE
MNRSDGGHPDGWQRRERAIIEDLRLIPGPEDRLAELMRLGRRASDLEPALCDDRLRIPGCVSRVWVLPVVADRRLRFRFAADSALVQGLVWLACQVAGGDPPGAIRNLDIAALTELQLDGRLSPTRRRGFEAVQTALRAWDAQLAAEQA